MQKLAQGLHHFQTQIFSDKRKIFERLSHGQSPDTLFITCSDSRIDPSLIMQTEPGELFILRNAGNIVPPYGAVHGGEAATIEYAVAALGVKDIVVCGHSLCGAMQGLLNPPSAEALPAVVQWLGHAESTRRIIKENYTHLSDDNLLMATIQENVLVQLENLRTHPTVAARLSRNELKLHGWVYKFQTGEIFSYDPASEEFVPLHSVHPIDSTELYSMKAGSANA